MLATELSVTFCAVVLPVTLAPKVLGAKLSAPACPISCVTSSKELRKPACMSACKCCEAYIFCEEYNAERATATTTSSIDMLTSISSSEKPSLCSCLRILLPASSLRNHCARYHRYCFQAPSGVCRDTPLTDIEGSGAGRLQGSRAVEVINVPGNRRPGSHAPNCGIGCHHAAQAGTSSALGWIYGCIARCVAEAQCE